MLKRSIVTISFALSLSACVAVPVTVQPVYSGNKAPSICVYVPNDPFDGDKSFPGDGMKIAERIRQTLERSGKRAVLIASNNVDAAKSCSDDPARSQLRTTVVSYRDFATGWSGKPDYIELLLDFTPSGVANARQATYAAKSNVLVAGALEWGNAKPWELLGGDFDAVVLKLADPG